MKKRQIILYSLLILVVVSCKQNSKTYDMKILFLHHSTGEIIWNGTSSSLFVKAADRISHKLTDFFQKEARLPNLFKQYNNEKSKKYLVEELTFPKESPYGWKNFPFDYYNIWIRNAGEIPFKEEPTLEMLTKEYQVIIFKHCFPVCYIEPDTGIADANSELKTLSNYKLQYEALRDKLHQFPETRFIVFTGAAQVKSNITEDKATRAKEFFSWVTEDWDLPDDNIYVWDLYKLQTEGDIYFKKEYSASTNDSHPNKLFAEKAVKLLFNRIIDVIETKGEGTELTGELK